LSSTKHESCLREYAQVSRGYSSGVREEEWTDLGQNIINSNVSGVLELRCIENNDRPISSSASDEFFFPGISGEIK
jgi:hypothetical protein